MMRHIQMSHRPGFLLWIIGACIGLTCCQNRPIDFDSFPKIDTHVHLRSYDPAFVEQSIRDNFRVLTIMTRSSSQTYIDEQYRFAAYMKNNFPETVFFATTFSMEDWGSPNWQTETIERLTNDFENGAIGVKVWKDIGMTFRDDDDNFIMIDDPGFDPVLDFIASQDRTLIAHIGEPRNCWLPLDSMTVNNDRRYFKKNPQYHMYLHPDYPSYLDHISARDRMLEKHPGLRVVGAHLGSLEWNVEELAIRLDRFPNLAVDMAARIGHFQVQNRKKVRDFVIRYQDRLLYATDLGVREGSNMTNIRKRIHDTWLEHWRYFTKDEEMTSKYVDGSFLGLKLPGNVLRKLYFENAKKWFPGMEMMK